MQLDEKAMQPCVAKGLYQWWQGLPSVHEKESR